MTDLAMFVGAAGLWMLVAVGFVAQARRRSSLERHHAKRAQADG